MIVKNRAGDGWVLDVLENFKSDRTLPKFRKSKGTEVAIESSKSPNWMSFPRGSFTDPEDSSDEASIFSNVSNWVGNESKEPRSFRGAIIRAVERLLFPSRKPRARPVGFLYGRGDPIQFFAFVRNSMSEAESYANRVRIYDAAIIQARDASQMARVSSLMHARQLMEQESILSAAGFKLFLVEAKIIEFASKCKKGLRLDWIANFSRQIPAEVVAKKREADTLGVFDNYVVLHYDPQGKAFQLTPAEEAAKRDPILFGVIDGVRKLYFIGDWKDGECDLTMEEVANVLGHPASTISEDPTKEP